MLTIYSGSSPCSAAVWIISRLRSRRKNVCSGSGALLFMSVAPDPELSLFHNAGSSSGFYSFSHINILIVFVCLKLNGKLMKSSTQNQNIPNILSNLIFFLQAALSPSGNQWKNEYKQFMEWESLVLPSMPEDLLFFLKTESRKRLFGKLHSCPSI